MLNFINKIFGNPNERKVKSMMPIVEHINRLEEYYAGLSDEELKAKTQEFKEQLANREYSDESQTLSIKVKKFNIF